VNFRGIGRRRAIPLAVVVCGALAALGLAPAGAEEKTVTFDGQCSAEGTVKFTPPATNDQQPLTAAFTGPGTCSGTLNGKEISDAKIFAATTARHVDGSCKRAQTTERGTGYIRFPDGTTLPFTDEFNFVGTDGTVTIYGTKSGKANGLGNFLNDRQSQTLLLECAGDGAKSAELDIQLMTESPLVSKASATGGRSGNSDHGGGSTNAKRLRLGVRPHRTRAGRHTTFVFRVTSAGKARKGAKIWFAGKRVRTNSKGRASVSTTLHQRGKRRARASKNGFVSVERSVRVR
jgi:hypothetical protein